MLLRMRKVLERSCRRNQNTRFIFSNFYSVNLAVYEIMCKKHKMPCCVSTATVVARTLHSCTLHGHCLSRISACEVCDSLELSVGYYSVQLDRCPHSSAMPIPVHEAATSKNKSSVVLGLSKLSQPVLLLVCIGRLTVRLSTIITNVIPEVFLRKIPG